MEVQVGGQIEEEEGGGAYVCTGEGEVCKIEEGQKSML
jgi:hypothetical protein